MVKDNGIMATFFVLSMAGSAIFMIWLVSLASEIANKEPNTKLTVQYDCRIAEISVDYPQQVKEQCRKILMPKVSYGEK